MTIDRDKLEGLAKAAVDDGTYKSDSGRRAIVDFIDMRGDVLSLVSSHRDLLARLDEIRKTLGYSLEGEDERQLTGSAAKLWRANHEAWKLSNVVP
jgi:hypothetical protein